MGGKLRCTVILGWFFSALGFAEDGEPVTLYQVGSKGNYCISMTKDTSHCISGVDDQGNTINVLDFVKGRKVVFENLSDAPHDMKYTGANAQDIPAQEPNAASVEKKMNVVDMNNQKITCSFHGDMLSAGYRVPETPAGGGPQGHPGNGEPGAGQGGGFAEMGDMSAQKIRKTGLVDVSKEVMAKGTPAEVQKLIAARPALRATLEEVRPVLAKELAAKYPGTMGALASPSGAAGGKQDGGFFGGVAGAKSPAVGTAGEGAKAAKSQASAGGGTGGVGARFGAGLDEMDEVTDMRFDRGTGSLGTKGPVRAVAKGPDAVPSVDRKVAELGTLKYHSLNGPKRAQDSTNGKTSWWWLILVLAVGAVGYVVSRSVRSQKPSRSAGQMGFPPIGKSKKDPKSEG